MRQESAERNNSLISFAALLVQVMLLSACRIESANTRMVKEGAQRQPSLDESDGSPGSGDAAQPAGAPIITKGLQNLKLNGPAPLEKGQFCVSATGSGLEYTWLKNGVVAPYNGNRPCYVAVSVNSSDTGTYTVSIKNEKGVASSSALLEVITIPSISAQLAARTVNEGTALLAGNFCVTASGGNLTYSWKKNGASITTQTKRCLLLSAVSIADTGSYTVTVSNELGSVTSSSAILTVRSRPAITVNLAPLTVTAGTSLAAGQFCVTAEDRNSPPLALTYSWKFGNATAPYDSNKRCYISTSPVALGDTGTYTVTITSLAGSVTSTAALTVIAPPVLTAGVPSTLSRNVGTPLVKGDFCISATGNDFRYVWKKDGVVLPEKTAKCLLVSALLPGDSGTYEVTASNALGAVTSSGALYVISPPSIVSPLPASLIRAAGSGLVKGDFCLNASGNGLSYSWTRNGVILPDQTAKCLLIPSLTIANAGTYEITATNSLGSVLSLGSLLINNNGVVASGLVSTALTEDPSESSDQIVDLSGTADPHLAQIEGTGIFRLSRDGLVEFKGAAYRKGFNFLERSPAEKLFFIEVAVQTDTPSQTEGTFQGCLVTRGQGVEELVIRCGMNDSTAFQALAEVYNLGKNFPISIKGREEKIAGRGLRLDLKKLSPHGTITRLTFSSERGELNLDSRRVSGSGKGGGIDFSW